jgi:hypothetical protein
MTSALILQTELNDVITEAETRGDQLIATQFSTVEMGGEIHYSALVLFRSAAETPEI